MTRVGVRADVTVAHPRRHPDDDRHQGKQPRLGGNRGLRLVGASAISLVHSQAARLESAHKFANPHGHCALIHEGLPASGGNVVVVEIESVPGEAGGCRELMQFRERVVADDVCPHGVVSGPDRLVNQHGHGPYFMPGISRSAACTVEQRDPPSRCC
jgi:hypothetical protein